MTKKHNKKQIILIGFAVLIAIILAVITATKIAERNDRERFANVESTKAKIVNLFVDSLGNKISSVSDRNECFHTEQGPFDKGRLWCQVSSIIQLKENADYRLMGEEYLRIGRVFGDTASEDGTFPSYRVELKDMSCQLQYKDLEGNDFGAARKIPFKRTDLPAVSISCADRAKARHY